MCHVLLWLLLLLLLCRQLQLAVKNLEPRVRVASKDVTPSLSCRGPSSLRALWMYPLGALMMWPLAWWLRRRQASRMDKYDKIM